MRRKHLILASCIISALLLTFTFHVSADENVTADAGASSNSAPLLDSYFWDNYYLLPYIESDGNQYVDTSINPDSNLRVSIRFSDFQHGNEVKALFGSYTDTNKYYVTSVNSSTNRYALGVRSEVIEFDNVSYNINTIVFDRNDVYANGNLLYSFSDDTFSIDRSIYIFGLHVTNPEYMSVYKLYDFSIYDYDTDEYVRYYYPAKSKSGNVIGLYDAVSKTFVTTSGNVPFVSPTDDQVIHFQIGDFITSGLGWIGDILDFAIEEPMILMFMAIGLCGVAFRWARRVVHF